MKSIKIFGPGIVAACVATASPLQAAEVTLTTGNPGGSTGFTGPTGWSSGAAPTAGNDYTVAVQFLRTPPDAVSYTFAGDSLSLNAGGAMIYKGSGTAAILTVNNFILNGGYIRSGSSFADELHIAGGLAVNGTGSYILADQGAFVFDSVLTGTGALATQGGFNITFNGASTYTGNLTASTTAATGTILSGTSHWKFLIGATGVSNTITGTGNITFNGTFDIDLTAAGDTVGNSWTLVNASTLAETFGGTFNIAGFTENNNIWTSADGKYQFLESTGVLSRINADTDGDGLADWWEMQYFGDLFQEAGWDYEPDFATNLFEFQSGTNPNDSGSFPNTDGDGLNDGWELQFFNNLAQNDGGDADNDYNTNLEEYLAGSAPNSAFSYPDTDDYQSGTGDLMNDGWEKHYFGTIQAADPEADPDGDLTKNLNEFQLGTDPTVQISSPDTDLDGLPDGWEVIYFRVGEEDLATLVTHQNGDGDPDGDGVNNKIEFAGGTDPTDPASFNPTLGYWRFEEAVAGEVPAGGNGAYAFPTSVKDSSPYGNHMMAWAEYSRPNYDAVTPGAVVPVTGATNTASLFFQRNGNGVYYIEAIFSTPTANLGGGQALLRTHTFNEFTIEASFNTTLTNQWQVPLSKLGNPVGGQSPFSLKIDPGNRLRAGLVDGSTTAREIIGTTTIATGSWYSAAVTATATEMKLWLKSPGDKNYKLEGVIAISGAWYVPAGGPLDTPWNVGQGMWNGNATDAFQGNIDEVRISSTVLDPQEFLFVVPIVDTDNDGMDDNWEETYFGNLAQTGTGDFDGDGTDNFTEYRLGLIPNSGASIFAASRNAAGMISWPSASGETFTIQRSQTLDTGSWTTVGTVFGGTGTATFTDPTPPVGNAFYKVLLEP